MGVREGCPERRVVYFIVSGGDCKDAISNLEVGRSGIKIPTKRIITGVDGQDGIIGQTGGILRLWEGGGGGKVIVGHGDVVVESVAAGVSL